MNIQQNSKIGNSKWAFYFLYRYLPKKVKISSPVPPPKVKISYHSVLSAHALPWFIAAHQIEDKFWKWPTCHSTDEWLATMWPSYRVGYCFTITKDKCVSFVGKVTYLDCITMKEINETHKYKNQVTLLTWENHNTNNFMSKIKEAEQKSER